MTIETALLQPTKYEKWMIETGRNNIGTKYHLLAKVLPGRGRTTGLVLHVLERLKLKERERPEDALYRNDKFRDFSTCLTSHARKPGNIRARAVIICSTREAAYATGRVFVELGQYLEFKYEGVVGGGSKSLHLGKFYQGLDVVVCTIGKMVYMLNQEKNLLCQTEILCFDDTKVSLQSQDPQTQEHVRQIIKLRFGLN